jgi:anti-anti-sigma factor
MKACIEYKKGSTMGNNEIIPRFDDDRDETLKIRLEKVPGVQGCLVLILNGYIDTYNSNYFQKQVQRAIEAGFIRLIFHCSGLTYVSSTGIGSFTAFLKAVKPKGGDLVLLEIQPKVYEVFQLLGFSQFFNIIDNLESSIGFFRGNVFEEEEPDPFPKVFPCPICSKKLKAVKAWRFRCSECKSILAINDMGIISLG